MNFDTLPCGEPSNETMGVARGSIRGVDDADVCIEASLCVEGSYLDQYSLLPALKGQTYRITNVMLVGCNLCAVLGSMCHCGLDDIVQCLYVASNFNIQQRAAYSFAHS